MVSSTYNDYYSMIPVSAEQRQAARLVVADRVKNLDDCRMVLDVLGLLDG